ncbi:MAG: hypothetical protein PHC56_05825 [Herbinix sp.]|nr:hypothetical protein [Herbinix sp.]
MGKIVMPKHSAVLEEIESTLEIYYKANGWMQNKDFKQKLKNEIGDDQYQSSYTKKMQVLSYFGFIEWEDINRNRSPRRITESGKQLYVAVKNNDTQKIWGLLVDSLENIKFGRDNFGCPDSNSDVEPPNVLIRGILDIGYLNSTEFGYLIWRLEDEGGNYTDVINEIKKIREDNTEIEMNSLIMRYKDWKPILIMARWEFLIEEKENKGESRVVINPKVLDDYKLRLRNLKIYNIDKPVNDIDDICLDENGKRIIKPLQLPDSYSFDIGKQNLCIEMINDNDQNIVEGDNVLFVNKGIKKLLAYNVYRINSIQNNEYKYTMDVEKKQLVNEDKEYEIIRELNEEDE